MDSRIKTAFENCFLNCKNFYSGQNELYFQIVRNFLNKFKTFDCFIEDDKHMLIETLWSIGLYRPQQQTTSQQTCIQQQNNARHSKEQDTGLCFLFKRMFQK